VNLNSAASTAAGEKNSAAKGELKEQKDSFGKSFISTLLLNFCHKRQETEECILKLGGYIDYHGTYTLQVSDRLRAGTEMSSGFFPVHRY
jgi:hypothetical protein